MGTFSKVFYINVSLLITFAYLINLGYKYVFSRISPKMNYGISVLLFIFAGWMTMLFGLRINEQIIFDLRFIPLITGIFVFPHPLTLFIIGTGIGLARLTFGLNAAALAGLITMVVLGLIAAGLSVWFRRSAKSLLSKMIAAIVTINCFYSLTIAILGVIPFREYIMIFVPYTLPSGILLSWFFGFILWDFYVELQRTAELKKTNELLREQKQALQEAKAALEDKARQLTLASQYKSEFLANMSHELKTPLNSIILLSQLVGDQHEGRFTEEELQYLHIIHSSGEELLRQINDILDLSKMEAGKMDIHIEEISLQEIPQILEHQFQWVSGQKGIGFDIRLGSGLPELIRTDGMRVHQILKNLLSNAFKFTSAGRVLLDVSKTDLGPDGRAGEWVAFSVADTGIGIAAEKHRLIFEAFRQADGSISRKYGGTGLGLSISLELAKLLGGHLTLTSVEGEGSTFTLFLPV